MDFSNNKIEKAHYDLVVTIPIIEEVLQDTGKIQTTALLCDDDDDAIENINKLREKLQKILHLVKNAEKKCSDALYGPY